MDDEPITDADFFHRETHLFSVDDHQSCLRSQVHECANGVSRALFRVALRRLGDGIQEYQHGGLRPLAHESGDDSRGTHQQLDADFPFLDQLLERLPAEIPAADDDREDIQAGPQRRRQPEPAAKETDRQEQTGDCRGHDLRVAPGWRHCLPRPNGSAAPAAHYLAPVFR